MKRLKMTRLMMLALVFTPLTSMAASPLAFNFSCASIGGVNSDGKGNVWIDGSKATVKAFNENYWEAKSGNNTVSISRKDDGNPDVSGVGRIESTGYACLKIILTFLGPKNRPALDPLIPALRLQRAVSKRLSATVLRSQKWI